MPTTIEKMNQLYGRNWLRLTRKVWISPSKESVHLRTDEAYKALISGKN